MALEVDEARRLHFPEGFPEVLSHCANLYMMGPMDPPAEGLVAWWAGARREVLRMIETVQRQPERYAACKNGGAV